MALTPEQRKASEALGEAIKNMTALMGDGMGAGVITDWMVVAAQDKFDDEGDRVTAYNVFYVNGSLPDHVARGLLRSGLAIIEGGWERQEDIG